MLEFVIFLACLPAAIGTLCALLWMLFMLFVAIFSGIGWLIGLPFMLVEKAWRAIKA